MLFAGRDDVIVGLLLLQHQPLRAHVVARMAPVAQRVEIAQVQAVVEAGFDAREAARDLARNERLAAKGTLVIEQDAVAGVEAVRLAEVHRYPICVDLRGRVRRTRVERRSLALWAFDDLAEHLRARGLIEPRLGGEAADPDRLEQAQRSHGVCIRGVFGCFERHGDVALRREVVDLLGPDRLHDADEIRRVREVAIVKNHLAVRLVRIAVEVIDSVRVER